ncbi:hypothetical protein SALBM217S_03896 [Streptomyces griseoloalbus]
MTRRTSWPGICGSGATEFLRALRLHRGAATPEESAEAARALRRAARRITARPHLPAAPGTPAPDPRPQLAGPQPLPRRTPAPPASPASWKPSTASRARRPRHPPRPVRRAGPPPPPRPRPRPRGRAAPGRRGDGAHRRAGRRAAQHPLSRERPPQAGPLLGGRGGLRHVRAQRRGGHPHRVCCPRTWPAATSPRRWTPAGDALLDTLRPARGRRQRPRRGLTAPSSGVHPSFMYAHRPLHLFCLISALRGADRPYTNAYRTRRPASPHFARRRIQDGGHWKEQK